MSAIHSFALILLMLCSIAHADVVGLNAATPRGTEEKSAPMLSQWTHQGGGIAYLFAYSPIHGFCPGR